MKAPNRQETLLWSLLALLLLPPSPVAARRKYDRIYEDMSAISFADPLKNGFRVILAEKFINTHLRPSSLPTIFASAIPLFGEGRVSKVLYPESVKEDKMVKIGGLAERSWYYVCIEWENINHHNETTGTSCKIYRTLDRFGKSATTAITDVQIMAMSGRHMRFKLKFDANYKARVTAYLDGRPNGVSPNRDAAAPIVAAKVFVADRAGSLDLNFDYLEPVTQYGRLCVIEEPMQPAYSAMGRLIAGLRREKCYFDGLKTKSEVEGLPMATQPAKAFRRVMNSAPAYSISLPVSLFSAILVLFTSYCS